MSAVKTTPESSDNSGVSNWGNVSKETGYVAGKVVSLTRFRVTPEGSLYLPVQYRSVPNPVVSLPSDSKRSHSTSVYSEFHPPTPRTRPSSSLSRPTYRRKRKRGPEVSPYHSLYLVLLFHVGVRVMTHTGPLVCTPDGLPPIRKE